MHKRKVLKSKASSAVTFYVRLAMFLATPVLFFIVSPDYAAIIVTAGILMAIIMDFVAGRTTWLAAHPAPVVLMFCYVLVIPLVINSGSVTVSTLLCLALLLLALSSDAVADVSRCVPLVITGAIAVLLTTALISDLRYTHIAAAFPPVAFLAAAVRMFFPKPAHLLHTSLDYPLARLEILSMGMKRVIAIGIRRNKLASMP